MGFLQRLPGKGLGLGLLFTWPPRMLQNSVDGVSLPPVHIRNIWGALNRAISWCGATQTSWGTTEIPEFMDRETEAQGVRLLAYDYTGSKQPRWHLNGGSRFLSLSFESPCFVISPPQAKLLGF